jgi:tetratricopeptide (TPR) repeat protein
MREILKEIRAGWNPSELEAYSFAEVARKRAEAASVPAEPVPPPKAEAPPKPPPKEEKKAEEPGDESDIVRDALGRLQAKVHEEIGDSDLETRYNLGIAYKEMGLHQEAVKEFRMSMKKPELVVGASSMLADTLSETGDVEGAIEVLDQALEGETITKEQHRDLRYHKAVLFSRGGREKEAGEIFIALAEEFPGYRDIDARAKPYRS